MPVALEVNCSPGENILRSIHLGIRENGVIDPGHAHERVRIRLSEASETAQSNYG